MTYDILQLLVIILGGFTVLESIGFIYLVHKSRLPRLVLLAPLITGALFLVVLFMLLDTPGTPPPPVY